ncbi:MAG: N-acetylneuraminate synthase family protein [Nitrosarchaeum sp.]
MVQIKIKNRIVGHNQPPFIVAEAGINHNGEIEKALKMIQVAKESNADAIKFQTFKAEEFIGNKELTYTYRSQGKEITESMYELHKRHEFNPNEWRKIKNKCDDEDIIFLSTAQNRSDLDLLLKLDIPAIKVGSDDFTNIPLLKDYSTTGLPILISCGMSHLGEIYETLNSIGSLDGYPTILLLTTSLYPTSFEDVNLLRLKTLSESFPMIPLGFSDHTRGPLASSLAVALGACLFEKHFTLDQNLPGPDHWFAENPESLKTWVDSIRKSHTILGNSIVRPTEQEELKMKNLARRSIVSLRDINEGEILNNENIGLRRPGNGLPPKFLDYVLGTKATRKISKQSLLKMGDFK